MWGQNVGPIAQKDIAYKRLRCCSYVTEIRQAPYADIKI